MAYARICHFFCSTFGTPPSHTGRVVTLAQAQTKFLSVKSCIFGKFVVILRAKLKTNNLMKQKLLLLLALLGMAMSPLWAETQASLTGICGRTEEYNTDNANLQYVVNLTTHTLTITGSGRMKDYDNDTKAPWYPWKDDIYTVNFPDGMTTVGSMAMYNLTNLTTINWDGNTVTHIYESAFLYCYNLPQLTLPTSVTYIGQSAFRYCSGMLQVILPNSLKTISNYAFCNCTSLTQLTLPQGVTSIGEYAFQGCSNLTTLYVDSSDPYFGRYSFSGCHLETIDFRNSRAVINYDAFNPAPYLTTIKAKKIQSIGSNAFYNCPQLVTLQLGDSLQLIGDLAFYNCNSLRTLHFPATLTSFYATSFKYCYALDTITVHPANTKYDSRNNCNAAIETATNKVILGCCKSVIPAGTTTIGRSAFYDCVRLKSVSLPTGLQSIEASAFYDCDSLQTVVLPEGLQSLGDEAFASCSQLTTINLPNSVTSIGCGVFKNCNRITTPIYNTTYFVYLPTSYQGAYSIPGAPQKIACEAFYNCDGLTSVLIPSSVTEIYGSAFKNSDNLQTAPLPAGLTFLGSSAFENCSALTSSEIPQGVPKLNNYVFSGCTNLQSVTPSEGLQTIGAYAFNGCSSLPSIVIPNTVSSIGEYAFRYCSSLSTITFPASLTGFGRDVLESCSNLRSIVWNVRTFNNISAGDYRYDPFYSVRGQITDFSFGDSVQVIPSNLCYNMYQLTALSLGANIQTIGNNVFTGCDNIKSVYWNLRTCADPQMYTNSVFYPLRDSITEFTFGDSVRHIPAFLCHSMSRLRELRIPANVSSIGSFAFRYVNALDSISVDEDNNYYDSRNNCNALIESASDVLLLGCYKTVFPYDITGIGDCAFRNVRKLRSVVLPEDVVFVGPEAFNGCHDVKTLLLNDQLETIDDYAFQDCDSVVTLTLPENVSTIGLRAFAHCSSLEAINCTSPNPPTIDGTSFSWTTCPIYVPCEYIAGYRSAPNWSDFGNRLTGEALYTLTIQPNEYSFGVVNILQQPDCEHTAILEAVPSRGCEFVAWQDESGQELSTDAHYEFVLEEDMNITGVFRRVVEGIENIWEEGTAIWYDLMGHRVDEPTHGVYIVQTESETRKVIIP